MVEILQVHRAGENYKVEFRKMDPDELALVVASVIRAAIERGGVDFGQILEYCRSVHGS
jgi:hypothetical protein